MDWELIGWTEKTRDAIYVLDELPEWLREIVLRGEFEKGEKYHTLDGLRYYFQDRSHIYRVDVSQDRIYVYRKRKEEKKEPKKMKRKEGSRIAKVVLTLFFLGLLPVFITYIGKENNVGNATKEFIENITDRRIIFVKTCEDGTLYGHCSVKKPLFCENGFLVPKPNVCGCPEKYVLQNESCVYALTLNPEVREFRYCLFGKEGSIHLTIYGGLNDYLQNKSKKVFCEGNYYVKTIDDVDQREAIEELVQKIKMFSSNKDDQARIAISLVQKLEYDYEGMYKGGWTCRNGYLVSGTPPRYPYQVLYDGKGICSEKSMLLALLLKELGFGVALLEFEEENHMAVGIKCFEGLEEYANYRYNGTGYCFVESTRPTIVTYDKGKYVGVGILRSYPKIIPVSDGLSFNSVWIESNDAKEWHRLIEIAERNNYVLDLSNYLKWQELAKKYCMDVAK